MIKSYMLRLITQIVAANKRIMRYIAFTICLVASVALIFFLRGGTTLSPPQGEQTSQIREFQSVQPIEPDELAEKTPQFEENNPCPDFPMPTNNFPLSDEQLKMVVKPDEKIDYKIIIINPCLPPVESEKPKPEKKRKTK